MSEGGQRGPSAKVNTPDRRKRGATTTGPRHTAQPATARLASRRASDAMTGMPRVTGDHSGATLARAGREPDLRQVVRRAVATMGIAVGAEVDRRGGMTVNGRRGPVPLLTLNVAIDRPDRHEAVHDRVQAGRRGVRVQDRDLVVRGSVHGTKIRQAEQEVAVTDRRMTIAIDGPAAAGKSTVGEIVARRIDGVYFDSGLLYRALTLLAIEAGVAPSDAAQLARLAAMMDISVVRSTAGDGRQVDVLQAGRDVTNALRTPEIDQNVSAVSAHAAVRDALLEQQRRIARSGRVVMVGRDIGTVVLPDAQLKIFLDASPEERARRRCQQLDEAGKPQPYDVVLADMKLRDRIDSERDVAPLVPAADSIVVDSDSLTIEEVADLIVSHAEQRRGLICR
ncbi:MAG: (d)CMP kinase [Thermomicrobiales bacterium]